MPEVRWGTKQTKGLTYRMACRMRVLLDNIKDSPLAPLRVITVGLDTKGKNNYIPVWMKRLDVSTYDDTWDDWQPGEIDIIRQRLRAGHDPDDIMAIFRPPSHVFDNIRRFGGISDSVKMDGTSDEFDAKEISDEELRQYANQEWRNYSTRVDLSQPTNRSAIRSLIILDIQLRRMDKRMLDPNIKVGDLSKLHSDYMNLRKMYSDAAEDVAQLERQRENRDIAYTFSQLIERTHDIRRQWEATKMPLHHQLEESTLIQNMVLLHKVDTRPIERFVERTGDIHDTGSHIVGGETIEEAVSRKYDPKDIVMGVLGE